MSSFSLPSPRISGGSQRSSPDHRHFRVSASSRARAKRQGPVQRSPLPTERLNRLIASKRLLQQNRHFSEVAGPLHVLCLEKLMRQLRLSQSAVLGAFETAIAAGSGFAL